MDFSNKQENLKEDKQFVIGKICFAVEKNTFYSAKENVRRSVIAIWIGLLVIGYVFIFVIYYSYIRPFHELQHFTTEIAKGNLDVALPIHKENMFQATLEELEELVVTPEETESVIIDSFFRELSSYGNIIIDNKLPECLVYMDRLRMEQVIGNSCKIFHGKTDGRF